MANDKNIKSLDDIVFEHKNKEYGAYRLRNNEKGYLLKAFLIGAAIFVLFSILLYSYNRWDVRNAGKDREVKIDLTPIDTPKEKKEKIIEEKKEETPPPPPPKQEEIAQIKFVMPEPKKEVEKEQTIPSAPETKNQNLGPETTPGSKPDNPFASSGQPNNNPPIPPPPKKVDPAKVYTEVEEEAEYPGGINALRSYVGSNVEYPEEAIDAGKEGRVIVRFVVEPDGTVSGLKVLNDKLGYGAGKEVMRVLSKTKKWKPGKVDGESVRSYFTFPIDFKLP